MGDYIFKLKRWYVDNVTSERVIQLECGKSFILPDGYDVHNAPLGHNDEYIVKNHLGFIINPYEELKEI